MKFSSLIYPVLGVLAYAMIPHSCASGEHGVTERLHDSIESIVRQAPGEIGVAVITDTGDTITVNNEAKYPMMSVFKLHQAIALCRVADSLGISLDSIVDIRRESLNADTWSPMLKEHPDDEALHLTVADLVRYALMQSDNNASNYMFENLVSVSATDSVVASVSGRDGFRISYSEADMWADHSKAYDNYSSPLAVARLLGSLMLDSIVSAEHKRFLTKALSECKTGADRIAASFAGEDGVVVYHKTGSGFRSREGLLAAHNDAAFISMPDGRYYTLVVLTKDTPLTEAEASAVIARISATVRDALCHR